MPKSDDRHQAWKKSFGVTRQGNRRDRVTIPSCSTMPGGLQRSMQDHPSNHAAFYALFDTSIGLCGLAWNERGVIGFQLPEGDASRTRGRIAKRFPGIVEAPPPLSIQEIIADVTALLRGEARDLSAVPLDMEGVSDFDRRVYEIARSIPPGRVVTYGEVASRLGINNARAIGQSLGRNPFAVIVPCHRVVAADGRLGGFSANGGAMTKRRLLAIEDARRDENPTLFDLIS
jgi:methylated-DNA-[protein]-cysteine S-methyltransferase